MLVSSPAAEYRRKMLLRPCWYWVLPLPELEWRSIAAETNAAFEAWKERQADADGNVLTYKNLGLLGTGEPRRVPLADARAPDCAPGLGSETALALKLWGDENPEFARLTRKHGLHAVLSLIALLDDAADEDVLIQLNALLVDRLIQGLRLASSDADFYRKWADGFARNLTAKKAAQQERVRNARTALGARRRRDMERARAYYYDKAVDYAAEHRAAKKIEVLDYLLGLNVSDAGITPKSRGVISQYIAGALSEGHKRANVTRKSLYDSPVR